MIIRVLYCLVFSLFLQIHLASAQIAAMMSVSDDSRVAQLAQQDPVTLVSEASYDRGVWPKLLESNISWKTRCWRVITRPGRFEQ